MKTSEAKEYYIELNEGRTVTIFRWSNYEGATISIYENDKEKIAFSGRWEELNALAMGINASQT